jgi:hypothetical protein
MDLYVLIFKVLDNRREDEDSGLNGSKHYPNKLDEVIRA